MTCRGICERHRAEKIDTSTILKDVHRVICICYMTEQSPCCSTQLRSKRKSKFRNI